MLSNCLKKSMVFHPSKYHSSFNYFKMYQVKFLILRVIAKPIVVEKSNYQYVVFFNVFTLVISWIIQSYLIIVIIYKVKQ